MRWTPLIVDVLHGLDDLSRAPGARFIVGPAGVEGEDALVGFLLREARGFHEVERDVANRRIRALQTEANEVGSWRAERDPRTAESRPVPEVERAHLFECIGRTRARLLEHQAALARLALPSAEEEAREIVRRYEVRPRAELEALKSRKDAGELVEVFDYGFSTRATLAESLAERREFLGLPAGKDWSDA